MLRSAPGKLFPKGFLMLLVLFGSGPAAASGFTGGLRGDYEIGPVYIVQNDNRYGAGGTRFGADAVGQQENLIWGQRLALELELAERHSLIFVYAPFDVATRVELEEPILFNATQFPARTVVDSRYLFDGYRLSYLYTPLLREQLKLQVGVSLQIRNAQVALTSVDGTRRGVESDIGLVGAVKARLFWDPLAPGGPYWMLDADGFSTFGLVGNVRGAIYDVALTLGIPLTRRADLTFRGRWLGGGATVPDKEIENWGNFVSGSVGLRVSIDQLLE